MPSLRDRRRADTRREITRAAMELFLSKGFESTTADDIALAAGVSRATFFNYFPQKELILAEFGRSRMERIHALIEESPSLRLDALLTLFISFGAENEEMGARLRTIIPHVLSRPACQVELRPLMLSAQKMIADGLQRGGELAEGVKPRIFAETFFAVYLTTTLQWALHPNPPKGWHRRQMRERLKWMIELARRKEEA